jgi:uncharacterized membrane protein YedE/YeeE
MGMILTGLIGGLIFGFGLLISDMVNPQKILNFLDLGAIATWTWDPSLAIVMGVALLISAPAFVIARRQVKPFAAPKHLWPAQSGIDRRLVIGSVLFGLGWGAAGLCPGPAIVDVASLSPSLLVFVAAMISGMVLYNLWDKRQQASVQAQLALAAQADG